MTQRALTVKKAEVEAITSILESEYDDAPSMARAILKEVYQLWRQRSWYAAVIWTGQTPSVVYGLEATEAAALKMTTGLPFPATTLRIESIEEAKERWAEYDEEGLKVLAKLTGVCENCGHREYEHHAVLPKKPSQALMKQVKMYPCSVRCKCRAFVPKLEEAS
jgi:hypothetical protein